MKKAAFTLALSFVITVSFAQNTYLKIINKDTTSISYPPGTEFELKNEHNYTVLKDNKTERTFEIDGNYTLIVHPSYTSKQKTYKLQKGSQVKIVSNRAYFENLDNNRDQNKITSNGVTGEKFITDSKTIKDSKNILFKLSNGITFQYNDGKYNAYLNEEENYLNIEGKYLIESEFGLLKLSFNPKTAETWWVFEPKH